MAFNPRKVVLLCNNAATSNRFPAEAAISSYLEKIVSFIVHLQENQGTKNVVQPLACYYNFITKENQYSVQFYKLTSNYKVDGSYLSRFMKPQVMGDSVSLIVQALRRIKLNHEKDDKIHLIIWFTDAQLLEVSEDSAIVPSSSTSYSFIEELKTMKNMLLEVSIICCKTIALSDAGVYDTVAVNMEMQIYKNNESEDRLPITFNYIHNNVDSLENYMREFISRLMPTVYASIAIGSTNTGRMSLLISLHFASITTYKNYSISPGIKALQCVKLVSREGLNPLLIRGNSYVIGCEMTPSASAIQIQQNKIIFQSLVTHLMSRDAMMIVSAALSYGNTHSLTYYVIVPPRANSLHGNLLLLELIDYDLMLYIDEHVRVELTSDNQTQRGDIDMAMDNILSLTPYEVACNSGIQTISPLLPKKYDSREVTSEMQSISVKVPMPMLAAVHQIRKTKEQVNVDEIEDDDL